jgi:hypothetical protein
MKKLIFLIVGIGLAIFLAGSLSAPAQATVVLPTLIQVASGTNATGNNCTLTFPSNIHAGDFIVFSWVAKTQTSTISISDMNSDTYQAALVVTSNTTRFAGTYYVSNSYGGSNTISATDTALNDSGHQCLAAEFSWINRTNLLDATNTAGGSDVGGGSSTIPNTTTHSAVELIIGNGGAPNTSAMFMNTFPGFTKISSSTGDRSYIEYEVVTSTGSYAANIHYSGSATWVANMATFVAQGSDGNQIGGD